jgi:biotin carboxyl carrier protein
VSAGDAVVKGQAVVIVSAMKMETTLVAPFDGTVSKVNVAEGDKVMPGDVLVDIEKDSAAY